jgi:hypothetical protein
VARLEANDLIADGRITERGRAFRDGVEAATDRAQDDLLAAIGDELAEVDEVASRLDAWSQRCIETGSFPVDPRKRAAG